MAVRARRRVGVDVENCLKERAAPLALARGIFTGVEARSSQALPADAQPRRFCGFWTLKEA